MKSPVRVINEYTCEDSRQNQGTPTADCSFRPEKYLSIMNWTPEHVAFIW